MTRRRVVVTGLGIISPVGIGLAESWANILAGHSGIARITRFDASHFPSQIAGEVKGFDVTQYIPAKEARRMDTFIHYGMAVGLQAWKDSGLAITPENATAVVPAYHTGNEGTVYASVFNDGTLGAYNFSNKNAQLLIQVIPCSDYQAEPGS